MLCGLCHQETPKEQGQDIGGCLLCDDCREFVELEN